jgi:hypothetical protein
MQVDEKFIYAASMLPDLWPWLLPDLWPWLRLYNAAKGVFTHVDANFW